MARGAVGEKVAAAQVVDPAIILDAVISQRWQSAGVFEITSWLRLNRKSSICWRNPPV